jgi:hypothetical protein
MNFGANEGEHPAFDYLHKLGGMAVYDNGAA